MHKCIKVKLFIYSGIIKIFKKYPKNQNYLFSYFLLSLSPFSLELTENTCHETLNEKTFAATGGMIFCSTRQISGNRKQSNAQLLQDA